LSGQRWHDISEAWQTLSRSNEMKKKISVWECPRCSYLLDDEPEPAELVATYEHAGITTTESEGDPKPGEIAHCFRCGKFAVIGEDLQLRMPTAGEQLAINTSALLTEAQIVWASYTGAREEVTQ
jgi:hypothetical protein